MNKDGIRILAENTLKKYEGEENIHEVISKLREELNDTLNLFLAQNYVVESDFPIEFENELGQWKIHSDGNTFVRPKKGTERIVCNITIKPTGEIESYE